MNNFNLNSSFLLSEGFEDNKDLMSKIKNEDENVLGEFIQKGIFDAEIDAMNDISNNIPFLFAIKEGKMNVAKKILSRLDPEYFLKKNSLGETILHMIVKEGLLPAISLICRYYLGRLDKKTKIEILDAVDNQGKNFLHYLFPEKADKAHNYLRIVGQFIPAYEFFKLFVTPDNKGFSPLAYAIQSPKLNSRVLTFMAYVTENALPKGAKLTKKQLGIQSDDDYKKFINTQGINSLGQA